nr:HAMP domain-containing sensor histidine kinase [Pseudoclavibacter chungangensis]
MAAFLAIFFGFGLTVVIFAAALTRLLVSATLQPLREVEGTAISFAAGDYSQRLAGATPNTEVGRLSRSLNIMLGRIDGAIEQRNRTIEQMRRFVGDASHELRTPLVTVRGYAELYRMGALDEPEKVGQAMDRIEKEALRMGGLVEDLLQLARLDETRELVRTIIDLEPIAEDAAMDATAQAPDRRIRALGVRVSDVVDGAPDALDADADAGDGASDRDVERDAAVNDSPAPRGVPAATDASGPASTAAPGEDDVDPAPENRPALRRWLSAARPTGLPRPNVGRILRRRTPAAEAEATVGASPAAEDAVHGPRAAASEDSTDLPAMVLANEDKVRQAISNLIGNALRYTPPGTPLEIGIALDPDARLAVVEIIDHGEGIPEPIRQKIFQRFWRADTSRDRATGGSGLGLAIVSAIMRANDGSVDVVETPGGGATFRLVFPLLMAEDVDEPVSTTAVADPGDDLEYS